MPRGRPVPITPEVLDWAIRSSGHSADAIAERLNLPAQTLRAWLTGAEQPGLTVLRRLASFLHRPLATFLLPTQPRSASVQVEFRHPPGEERRSPNPVELANLREASRIQRGLAWIQSELGDPPVTLTRVSTSDDYEEAAAEQRRRIGITISEQLEWRTHAQALHSWRHALQESRVIVFLLPMGSSSSRGFSLWNEQAPLIAVNTYWNYAARIFTLFHEYAHLITRTNSSCVGYVAARLRHNEDHVERWCERFAAAFLAPWRDVENALVQQCGWRKGHLIEDLQTVRRLSNMFHISLRAMTIRLIDHEATTWDLYRQIPMQSDQKHGGGGGEGRRRLQIMIDKYGERTANVLVRGLQNDALSRTDVLGYLDVADSDLDYLESQAIPR